MRYRIQRDERVDFSAPVREHHFECRIAPWDDASQSLTSLQIDLEPIAEWASHRDCFGNQVHRAALLRAHDLCQVHLVAEVETRLANPFDYDAVVPEREAVWIADSLRQAPRLWDYVLHRSALTPAIQSFAQTEAADEQAPSPLATPPTWRSGVPLLKQVQDACLWVQAECDIDPARPPAAALAELCQEQVGNSADLAHLLIAIVRGWAIPARFVSGYLDPGYFEPDDDDPEGTPARAQALHHWVEVLLPGGGWRGIDPAQGLFADDTYVRLAVGRDLQDVTGFRHSFKGDGEFIGIETSLNVQRLD
ncbi:MAG TPA: transglutaminase family protein [Chromatiaceae bacterium]|jgi:transglutaminase-like putative cysteine protease|nr:MAG: hypothetical protein N838_32070 [Thiohalocapsa sp. PB-PSB1]QQO56892.1 MAG: transglutaminase family protein [Thiohalocapsa sp. PB-PSB1]HBG94753.1 transglutaminase family protein [Chromatiaceae bacterium]HCS89694.1 transglutaminase family protein [Chromatiaceae bacterium]